MARKPNKLSLKLTYGRLCFTIYLPALSLARVLNKLVDMFQYLHHKGIIDVIEVQDNFNSINAFAESYNIIYGKAEE